MLGETADPSDLLDTASCDPAVCWTTGNVAEAFPGVFTTFGFSFIHEPVELAFRRMLHALGVFDAADLTVPPRVEDQFWTAFAGRAAANIDQFRRIAALIPGTSASAVEAQLFGHVRPGTVDRNSARRYPLIALKAPRAVLTLPARHDAMFAEFRTWRLRALARIPELDSAGCLALLADARQRFGRIMVEHLVVAFVSSGLADRLAALAAELELPGLEARLLSGVGSDENEVAADLWSLAHDRLDLATFLDRHGYHGPNEGQIHGVCWREDPDPVLRRLDDYRAIGACDPRAPRNRSAAQARVRAEAAAELAAHTRRRDRVQVQALTRMTARFLALREQGKAGYLLTFDVARAAARRLGEHLVADGVLAEAGDVFHLSYPELRQSRQPDRSATVVARRRQHAQWCFLRLPLAWVGVPEVTEVAGPAGAAAAVGTVISGVAASSGVAEGRARVIRDPADADIDDGDILVCETTDPGWVSLFLVAGAVVTDHGGMLSHGPIVARELGLPCVCGTSDASRRLLDGQRIRVDGDHGTVEVLG